MRSAKVTARLLPLLLAAVLVAAPAPVAAQYAEVPAGTHFLVELRTKLEAKKVKPGKKFEARTLEPLYASDGSLVPAGAKLKGTVSHAERDKLILRFERFYVSGQKVPIVATVVGVSGEKHVKKKASEEGEIKASGSRGKNVAIGAAVGAGAGAGVGAAAAKDTKGTLIGAGIGAAAGALIGAATGGRDLVLTKGARLELELDRPLAFTPKRK